VRRHFAFLDGQLATRPFLAGQAHAMADIVALCTYDFNGHLNELDPEAGRACLLEWYERVSGRPSASACARSTHPGVGATAC